jgi:hypothetical protein
MIKTINHLHQASKYINEGSLVLLDLDDTLFICCNNGKDKWHSYDPNERFRKRIMNAVGNTLKIKDNKFYSYNNPYWNWVVREYNKDIAWANYRLISQCDLNIFRAWNNKCDNIWGLTSRGFEISTITEAALKRLGYNFKRTKGITGPIHSRSYRTGLSRSKQIIYCGGADKGEIVEWLPTCLFYRIIIIDDQLNNIKSVHDSLPVYNQRNFIGLHYDRNS